MGNLESYQLAITVTVPISVTVITLAILIACWFNQKDKRKLAALGKPRKSKTKSTQTIVKPFKADASGQTKVNIHVPHSIGDSDNRSTLIHVPGTSSRKSVTFTNEQSANYDKVSKVVLNPKHVVSVITVENKPRDTGIEGKPKLNMDMSNEQTNGKQLYGRKRKLSDTYKRRTSTIDNGKVQNENNDEEEVSRTINQPNKGAPNAAIKQADSRNTRDLRERPKSLTSLLVFKTPTIISTGSSISLGQYKCDSSS